MEYRGKQYSVVHGLDGPMEMVNRTGRPTAHASGAAELHLAVDCNPRRSSHGQQPSSFTIGRCLGNAFAAVTSGLFTPGKRTAITGLIMEA